MNVKNTIQTHAHKSVILVGPNHQPIELQDKDQTVESLAKDRQIQIEFPKSKRPIKNRVGKQEILNR